MDVLNHPMVVVTGKGGVGKSTVAAALGLGAAGDGCRVAVGELGGHARVAGLLRGSGIDTLTVDVHHALTEWLATQLPRRLADLLMRSGAFASLVAAAPGGAELIAITKLWELVQRRRRAPGAQAHDPVIVDAPAAGPRAPPPRAPRPFPHHPPGRAGGDAAMDARRRARRAREQADHGNQARAARTARARSRGCPLRVGGARPQSVMVPWRSGQVDARPSVDTSVRPVRRAPPWAPP